MKPAGLKELVENESVYHKAKIVCFSLLMFSIGSTYVQYFDTLVYRSGIFQQKALANEDKYEFVDFRNPLDPRTIDFLQHNYFQASQTWLDDWNDATSIAKHKERILTWSEARWNEWETMHDNVLWFDTAGCLTGGFIGEVNQHYSSFTPGEDIQTWTGENAD